MRLHTDAEIEAVSKADILQIMNKGYGHSISAFEHKSVEDLHILLAKLERTRMLCFWHDHSTLLGYGLVLVMVGVMYDPLVHLTEEEVESPSSTNSLSVQ